MKGKPSKFPYVGYLVYDTPPMKDGRKRVYLYHPDTGKRKWLALAKYNLEIKLRRVLLKGEQADHKDGDFTNDNPRNLQVLSAVENSRKSKVDNGNEAKFRTLKCPECKTKFTRRAHRVDFKIKQGKQPCCSRSCATKHSSTGR